MTDPRRGPDSPLRILLVEDEEAHAELVARAFDDSTRPSTLRVVTSIRAARAAIAAETPDLVLADLRLPDGDGLELLAGEPETAGYPVVIMTSHGDEGVAVDTMKTGALDYVVKSEESFAQMPLIAERALRGWGLMVQRRRAEQALRESEEHFRSLIENALDLISILGADGRIHYVSPAVRRVLGYEPEALVGTSILDHVHEADRPNVTAFLSEVFGQPLPRSLVCRVRASDGEFRVLEAVGSARPEGGGARRAVVNSRDISERTRAEAEARRFEGQLRQAQRLETLGMLAGGIAHDFNNILQAILGCAELARASNPGSPVDGYLDRLLEASHRARSLVKQILAFGRRGEAGLRPLLVAPVLQEALRLLKATSPRNIEIRSEARGDLTVLADPTQILQVVMNLGTNAQHAMEEKGGILELRLDRPGADEGIPGMGAGRYVRLRVRDTGHGMPEHVRERIFEPFFTTKGLGKGSGLGLSVVHGIVVGHGGLIRVESAPEEGTVVEVFLPEAEEAEVAGADIEAAVNLEGRHVLYVDDEPLVAATVRDLLESRGARVVARSSPRQALEALGETGAACDVAILDHNMPQMSGVELAQALRRIRPALPIVVVSGYGEALSRDRLAPLGVFSYLPKPFGTADLLRAVGEALRGAGGR